MFLGQSDRPYLTVEEAARMLRVNPATLYRNLHDVPHVRVGNLIKVRCEWLFLAPPERFEALPYKPEPFQPTLFDVAPERRWRNSKRLVRLDPFGDPLDALANFS